MGTLTPQDAELLVCGAGVALLESLPPYDEAGALRLGEQLRAQGHDPRLVAAVMTQSRLRARARVKLGDLAGELLLTADGLEQATRPVIAARHAARFVAAGVTRVLDLGCGLGLDAHAFAQAGLRVEAVDTDPATAALAAHNLRALAGVRVTVGSAEDALTRSPEAAADDGRTGVWFDPARRTPGRTDASGRTRRVFALDRISPSWDVVQGAAGRFAATGAKLSPGFPHARIPAGVEAEWVSLGGEVLECALWWGPLVVSPGRSATVIGSDGIAHRIREGESAGAGRDATKPGIAQGADGGSGGHSGYAGRIPATGDFLYDPDRAVVRAGLVAVLAARTGGVELSAGAGYVVGPERVEVAWARRFVVRETVAATTKALRAWARAHGVGRLTIKKRGSSLDPDRLRAGLKLDPSGAQATIVLTSCGGRQIAAVVRPD